MYDAQAGGRSPVLDGPWWLGSGIAVALVVLVAGSGPWRWIGAAVVAVLFSVPFCVRSAVAIGRSVRDVRAAYRS